MTVADVVIIGAGGAGLMCALTAGRRGRRVVVFDHAKKIGEKIRISGGGRCNFTNLNVSAENYLSDNPHFCRSALARFTPRDFINMVEAHGITYHEKTLGQLFCDNTSQDIIRMLVNACEEAGVQIKPGIRIEGVLKTDNGFDLTATEKNTSRTIQCESLVIATGGLSIPKMGATDFGYHIARQFGLRIVDPRPGLAPFTCDDEFLAKCAGLSGASVNAEVTCNGKTFSEAMLFTHRGLSGPAILQISSYWTPGSTVAINLCPGTDIGAMLISRKTSQPKQAVRTALSEHLPKKLSDCLSDIADIHGRLADISDRKLKGLAASVHNWQVMPTGTEGYRKAEVTVGGVDTAAVSSKTMESFDVAGLYFIGEVVDVTGHLGGYNFQWAWSSGHAAGSFA